VHLILKVIPDSIIGEQLVYVPLEIRGYLPLLCSRPEITPF
jgi:hypothetical protein